ncbi:acyltransferase family protein [Streptomyces yaizuensis]|uniref:Acyltransferase family protein n=1 Tax=Streptomyces yaizuensis TaxID=2989713 RepID=A0ABQ5NTK1_9ACTN|nr:acyltransferase family protein [Streptomyces sp. YSPA8]GLF93702.1 acyltransferase family protein [Streptomyces sp. YSPA8]
MFHAPLGNRRAPGPKAREPAAAPAHLPLIPSPRAAGPLRAGRDPFFDNAKYLAIVLVAVAHAWEPVMADSRATRALYLVIYAFHMPAFIVISGYFSRSWHGGPTQLRRLVATVAVPYVVFETVYSLFRRWADDEPGHPISLLDPFYLTWFLAALFIWRLLTPLLRQLRHPLAFALGVAALASATPGIGADLNLQRVLQFLPFFVLGLVLRPDHFRIVRSREARLLAVPLFAGVLGLAYWLAPRIRLDWVYRNASAQELGMPWWSGLVATLVLFGSGVLLTAAFLAWVPRRRTWFTALGLGTICGYLLHGLPLKAAEYGGFFEAQAWTAEPYGLVLLTLAAAAAVTLMCAPPVRKALRTVTEPELRWAFRDPDGSAETGTGAGTGTGTGVDGRVTDPAGSGSARTSR